MSIEEIEFNCEEEMERTCEFFRNELRTVRTGRASAALVDHLRVDVQAYGSTMQLRELAAISTPDHSLILIKPFDPGTTKDIERAIQGSDIGITPVSDGKAIRLPIPPLSGERRTQIITQVRKMAETQKVAVRNTRRDANKHVQAEEKASNITEDDAEKSRENIQELTKKYEGVIDDALVAKTKEIQAV